ncbi:MAG: hypothetical protein HYZ94_00530 [Candidatus Omnitrophica bacterium]|nr:hypothetical protein [Candidatus Omnitrophota bacterium]
MEEAPVHQELDALLRAGLEEIPIVLGEDAFSRYQSILNKMDRTALDSENPPDGLAYFYKDGAILMSRLLSGTPPWEMFEAVVDESAWKEATFEKVFQVDEPPSPVSEIFQMRFESIPQAMEVVVFRDANDLKLSIPRFRPEQREAAVRMLVALAVSLTTPAGLEESHERIRVELTRLAPRVAGTISEAQFNQLDALRNVTPQAVKQALSAIRPPLSHAEAKAVARAVNTVREKLRRRPPKERADPLPGWNEQVAEVLRRVQEGKTGLIRCLGTHGEDAGSLAWFLRFMDKILVFGIPAERILVVHEVGAPPLQQIGAMLDEAAPDVKQELLRAGVFPLPEALFQRARLHYEQTGGKVPIPLETLFPDEAQRAAAQRMHARLAPVYSQKVRERKYGSRFTARLIPELNRRGVSHQEFEQPPLSSWLLIERYRRAEPRAIEALYQAGDEASYFEFLREHYDYCGWVNLFERDAAHDLRLAEYASASKYQGFLVVDVRGLIHKDAARQINSQGSLPTAQSLAFNLEDLDPSSLFLLARIREGRLGAPFTLEEKGDLHKQAPGDLLIKFCASFGSKGLEGLDVSLATRSIRKTLEATSSDQARELNRQIFRLSSRPEIRWLAYHPQGRDLWILAEMAFTYAWLNEQTPCPIPQEFRAIFPAEIGRMTLADWAQQLQTKLSSPAGLEEADTERQRYSDLLHANGVVFHGIDRDAGGTVEVHRTIDGLFELRTHGNDLTITAGSAAAPGREGPFFSLEEGRQGGHYSLTVFQGLMQRQQRKDGTAGDLVPASVTSWSWEADQPVLLRLSYNAETCQFMMTVSEPAESAPEQPGPVVIAPLPGTRRYSPQEARIVFNYEPPAAGLEEGDKRISRRELLTFAGAALGAVAGLGVGEVQVRAERERGVPIPPHLKIDQIARWKAEQEAKPLITGMMFGAVAGGVAGMGLGELLYRRSSAGMEEGIRERIPLVAGSTTGKVIFITPGMASPTLFESLKTFKPASGEQLPLVVFAEHDFHAAEVQEWLNQAGLKALEVVNVKKEAEQHKGWDLFDVVAAKQVEYYLGTGADIHTVWFFQDLKNLGRFLGIAPVHTQLWERSLERQFGTQA